MKPFATVGGARATTRHGYKALLGCRGGRERERERERERGLILIKMTSFCYWEKIN